jgi:hypothetical protein
LQCPDPANPCSAETTNTFTAQDTSTLLSFTDITTLNGSSPTGLWYVDDVDVEAQLAHEPSGILLLAVALAGIGLARRRAA